ncbi:hypothetical protein BU23DRAFT_567397 [Bimuria novae-zelandiae CBS 107.79]|uniref:Heterokaryon incompatibility domain-containing protein n=1 Tax=Bimuria novae-zelandiae CBS 107.79 TaxID=1447943 RepID=A0A6A5VD03_9PLEO|nr:hypothetical protein BU23DRAFT_567397 [Bimuria novae-zelandiae CBS 107.79]
MEYAELAASPEASPITEYTYEPLRTLSSIRVLEFLSHDVPEVLHLRVRQIDLLGPGAAPCPPFRCLSYTWGNPFDHPRRPIEPDLLHWQRKHKICLSNPGDNEPRIAFVATNLYHFLIALKAQSAPNDTPIWIDALSINQNDLQERAHQVSWMGTIYNSCTEAIIWLGKEGEETATVYGLVGLLWGIPEETWLELDFPWIYKAPEKYEQFVERLRTYGISAHRSEVNTALVAFFSRSWFKRVWTIQECILPPKAHVWCGHHRLADFERLARLNTFAWWNLEHHFLDESPKTMPSFSDHEFVEFEMNPIFRYLSRFVFKHKQKINDIPPHVRSFEICLYTARYKRSSDPRDAIYGTLGLQLNPLITPDYTTSTEELFKKVALLLLEEFYKSREDDLARRLKNLPSWVPDWSAVHRPEPWTSRGGNMVCSAGTVDDKRPTFTCATGDILETEGFGEDEILYLGGNCRQTLHGSGLLESLQALYEAYNREGQKHGLIERFWRTMIADLPGWDCIHPNGGLWGPAFSAFVQQQLSDYMQPLDQSSSQEISVRSLLEGLQILDPAAHLPSWKHVMDAVSLEAPINEIAQRYRDGLSRMFDYRRFFITAKGRMGIASQGVQKGDLILVIKNVHYPFLMRKCPSGRYRYLSLAYVDGIMYGEALATGTFQRVEIE